MGDELIVDRACAENSRSKVLIADGACAKKQKIKNIVYRSKSEAVSVYFLKFYLHATMYFR